MQTELPGTAIPPGLESGEIEESSGRDPMLGFVKRWWWLLAIGVIAGVGVALAYRDYGPVKYTTTALVQIPSPNAADPSANARAVRDAAANYAAQAASPRTFALVGQALSGQPGLDTQSLLNMSRNKALIIKQTTGSNFVSISVTDTNPAHAKLIADTFAKVFVDDVNTQSQAQSKGRMQGLQQQIDFARQQLAAGNLYQSQQDLQGKIRDQRTILLQLQSEYQRDLQSQAIASEAQSKNGTAAAPTADQAALATSLQNAVNQQIKEVLANLDQLNQQIQDVQGQIAKLPSGTDPALVAAYASAYSTELTNLTNQYVGAQVDALTASPTLIQAGQAPQPFMSTHLKKLLTFGVGAGVAVAAAFAFLLDLLLKRRRARRSPVRQQVPVNLEELLKSVDRLGRRSAPTPAVDGQIADR